MKRFFLLAAFCAILSACGNPNKPLDSDISEDPMDQLPELPPDYAWMTLSTKFVFDEEPLRTKAGSSDDLYVVGVHQIIQAVMPHSGARYTDYGKYAYGVFDDLSHAIFKVAKSFHYGICVIYIPNGKNVLKNYGSDYYGAPCRSIYADSGSPDHQAAKLNEILYGYETPDLNWGFAETKDNTSGKLLWNTVERYQGSQRDVIIYSFTVSHPSQLDFLTANCFTEADGEDPSCTHVIDRKLNVVMTRARHQLLMTGCASVLRQNALFRKLISLSGGQTS
jgi:hypothetical protein